MEYLKPLYHLFVFLDIISNLPNNDSLEEEDEGSFSGSPSDVEPDGSIESVRRFFAETLGLGLLNNLVKEKPTPPIVSYLHYIISKCFDIRIILLSMILPTIS